jgi:hypothetical protein
MQQESTWVLYDLRDAEAWARAGRECRAWGLSMIKIHELDTDHVLIEYKAGGALEQAA